MPEENPGLIDKTPEVKCLYLDAEKGDVDKSYNGCQRSYFMSMSKAMATQCKGEVFIMTMTNLKEEQDVPEDGIWWQVEFPTLIDPNRGDKAVTKVGIPCTELSEICALTTFFFHRSHTSKYPISLTMSSRNCERSQPVKEGHLRNYIGVNTGLQGMAQLSWENPKLLLASAITRDGVALPTAAMWKIRSRSAVLLLSGSSREQLSVRMSRFAAWTMIATPSQRISMSCTSLTRI